MQIRAENDPRFWRKFLIMGVCALGFAVYCLYDGVIGYPANREDGYQRFKEHFPTLFADPKQAPETVVAFEQTANEEQRHEWDHYLEERDIPGHASVVTQFVMASISGAVGLLLIAMPLRARGRWIEADDNGIRSSWGQAFRYDEVERVNKRSWRKKGIAKVTYVGNNRRGTFVVDDFKFERYSTDAILYQLEQKIDPGRIELGPPEPEPEGKIAEALEKARSGS